MYSHIFTPHICIIFNTIFNAHDSSGFYIIIIHVRIDFRTLRPDVRRNCREAVVSFYWFPEHPFPVRTYTVCFSPHCFISCVVSPIFFFFTFLVSSRCIICIYYIHNIYITITRTRASHTTIETIFPPSVLASR